jgi:hypothetical protein
MNYKSDCVSAMVAANRVLHVSPNSNSVSNAGLPGLVPRHTRNSVPLGALSNALAETLLVLAGRASCSA